MEIKLHVPANLSNGLDHFLEAQEPIFDQVIGELRQGGKRSHWMWFIFPQVVGLGRSQMARKYAIHSLEEARHYAAHPVLGDRLRRCTRLVWELQNRDLSDCFGSPDDLKFHSSMTLFALATPGEPLFTFALEKYFQGQKDKKDRRASGYENMNAGQVYSNGTGIPRGNEARRQLIEAILYLVDESRKPIVAVLGFGISPAEAMNPSLPPPGPAGGSRFQSN